MSETEKETPGADGTETTLETEAVQNPDISAEEAVEQVDPFAEWKSKVTYLAAEIDNMKKRFTRERADIIRMANEDLVKSILPVFDNLFLALKSIKDLEKKAESAAGDNKIVNNLLKGVDMTLTHFEQTLERTGVKTVDSVGKPFDPTVHEAMGESQDQTLGDNVVSSEFQKGFTLHGRVIRPARVIVNKRANA